MPGCQGSAQGCPGAWRGLPCVRQASIFPYNQRWDLLPASGRCKGAAPSLSQVSSMPQCPSPVGSLPILHRPKYKFAGVPGWLHRLPWYEGSVATASLPPSLAPTVLPCRVAVLPPERLTLTLASAAASGPARAWKPHMSLVTIITWGVEAKTWDKGGRARTGVGRLDTSGQATAVRMQGHGASVSLSLCVGLLSSSNVSSTTCHRQLSSGNSLSTRLTRK